MGAADLCCPGNVISEPFAVPLNSREFLYLLFWGSHSRTIVHVLFGRCFGPFLSQAPEASAGSTASVRPTQEEQSTTPPGKVVTISSRSPRCPRNQSALRNGKTFSPNSAACSSGGAQGRPCWAPRWAVGAVREQRAQGYLRPGPAPSTTVQCTG